MRLEEACISASKDRESSFHNCRVSLKLVLGCLSTRKHRESCINHHGRPVELVESCICARKDQKGSFHHCMWRFCEARADLFNG